MEEILKVERISQTYQAENGELTALDDISFSVEKGSSSASSDERMRKVHPLVHRGRNDSADIRQSRFYRRTGRRDFSAHWIYAATG